MKLATALRLGRVSNLPTVVTNVLAGVALAAVAASSQQASRSFASLGAIALVCLAAALLYVGGMFLNDAFDAEYDARERAERPIPAGLASRTEVFVYGVGMLLVGIAIAGLLSLASGLAALATAAMIVLYDAVHKKTVLAPLLMGLCRVGVYWTAAFLVPAPNAPKVALGSAVLCAYVLALTYAAARENTTALVRFGPLVGLYAPLFIVGPGLRDSPLGVLCLLMFVGFTVRNNQLVRTRQPAKIRVGIGGLIAGISLLDALWLASSGAPTVAILGALVAFGLTLLFQRYVAGT